MTEMDGVSKNAWKKRFSSCGNSKLLLFIFAVLASFSILTLPSSPIYQDQIHKKENQGLAGIHKFTQHIESKIYCDRSHHQYDLCLINGSTVLEPGTSTFYAIGPTSPRMFQQKIRPYPRKWENFTMSKIKEVTLISSPQVPQCDIIHNTSALVFSVGGYTGNFFHDFNEGFLPLFITVRLMSLTNQDVVLVIQNSRQWWVSKYRDILGAFSDYPIINLDNEINTHCFKSAIFGLVSHGFMSINSNLLPKPATLLEFHKFLDNAYSPRPKKFAPDVRKNSHMKNQNGANFFGLRKYSKVRHSISQQHYVKRPKLILVTRANGAGRVILNQDEIITMAENIGFDVIVFEPKHDTPLSEAYGIMNESHVLVGVHGAALTHFLFLRPNSILIQVVPLGIDGIAEMCFGRPAKEMGLVYLEYKISIEESSLLQKYNKLSPIIQDPISIQKNGWDVLKKVYLKEQNIKLDMIRFRKYLKYAYKKAMRFM